MGLCALTPLALQASVKATRSLWGVLGVPAGLRRLQVPFDLLFGAGGGKGCFLPLPAPKSRSGNSPKAALLRLCAAIPKLEQRDRALQAEKTQQEPHATRGPSGVGVNELRRRLIGINPHHFQSAVPHTTRAQKSYEENGREYHYVLKETFENMVYGHRMMEYGEYKGNLYGTSIDAVRAVLDEGKICIVDLEPQSIPLARTHELKPYIIFIKPSSLSCMKQSRKNARMITDYYVNMKFKEEDLQEMEESAKKMEAQFGQFFDHVIVNDNLQEACMQLLSAVRRAQDEPQWVPATWICSENQP